MIGPSVLSQLERRLDPLDDLGFDLEGLRPAAVVGLLLDGATPESTRLVFIERSSELRQHAGQIAFPGGKPEPGDRDLVETALREAEEEVGLERGAAEVVGRLLPVPTPTGFLIVPFVARVRGPWLPTARSGEVQRVLTPSLAELADPAIYQSRGRVEWKGQWWEMHEYRVSDPPIWGATARMVWDLLSRLRAS